MINEYVFVNLVLLSKYFSPQQLQDLAKQSVLQELVPPSLIGIMSVVSNTMNPP